MMRLASLCSVLLAAACGGGTSPVVEDGPGVEAGPGDKVRVTVTQGGQPVSALPVHFLEADGTLVALATTDAAGQATAALHANGSVTVVHGPLVTGHEVRDLDSWVGVQPGDDLALDLPVFRPAVNVEVTVPIATLPGVASYSVVTPCGGTGFFSTQPAPLLSLLPNCIAATATTDFIVFAQDATGHPIAAFVVPHLGVTNGQHVALAGTYQPLIDVPILYANVGSTQDLAVTGCAVFSDGLTTIGGPLLHGTGSIAGTFPWPAQLTTGTRVLQTSPDAAGVRQTITSWGPIAASEAIDFTDLLGQGITSGPTLDAGHQHLGWTLADHGAPAQLAIATLFVNQPDGEAVGWTLVAPGAAPQLALPPLPSTLIDFSGPQLPEPDVVLLRVPGGTASWTRVLGAGGYLAGPLSALSSGMISEVSPPGAVIP